MNNQTEEFELDDFFLSKGFTKGFLDNAHQVIYLERLPNPHTVMTIGFYDACVDCQAMLTTEEYEAYLLYGKDYEINDTHIVVGLFCYHMFKAALFVSRDETEFVVFHWENSKEKFSDKKLFSDIGSVREYFERVVEGMISRTSRSMVQCYLC